MHRNIKILIEKVQAWFPKATAKIETQANALEIKLQTTSEHSPLPSGKIKHLQEKIKALSSPSIYQTVLKSKLNEAIATWQTEDNLSNTLVVLGSPVEPIELILQQTIAAWYESNQCIVQCLPWSTRPHDHTSIRHQLQEAINFSYNNHEQTYSQCFVIPNISWCFLRCVDGLEGIDYLQKLIFQDRSRFWLIGCNNFTWQYLDRVCHISTYFDQTVELPSLKNEALKAWLAPVSDTLTLEFEIDDDSDNQNETSDDWSEKSKKWNSKAEQAYFDDLVKISHGSSSVAAQLWLHSLCSPKQEEKTDSTEVEQPKEEQPIKNITLIKQPKRPSLPSLSQDNRYLLFSLCLHGKISLSDLALSLGEKETNIQAQVQSLRRSGIIESDEALFFLNPAYYIQIEKNLENNKFPVGDKS